MKAAQSYTVVYCECHNVRVEHERRSIGVCLFLFYTTKIIRQSRYCWYIYRTRATVLRRQLGVFSVAFDETKKNNHHALQALTNEILSAFCTPPLWKINSKVESAISDEIIRRNELSQSRARIDPRI